VGRGNSATLTHLGFEALATTTAGYAFSVGRQDSSIARDKTMAHVAAIASVVSSVNCPVNVVMGLKGVQLSQAELSANGVRRVSVGSALSRAALGAFLRAAKKMREHGSFVFATDVVSYRDINAMFKG